jgi:hypothetical protein
LFAFWPVRDDAGVFPSGWRATRRIRSHSSFVHRLEKENQMESIRSHFSKVHEHLANHATAMAGLEESEATRCQSAGDKECAAHHTAKAKELHKFATTHGDWASMMKAADAEFEKRLVPDSISSVASADIPFGIRSVPRSGAQAADQGINKAAIPPQFQHLISSDEA